MFDDHSDSIRDLAVEFRLATEAQAAEVWEGHLATGKPFADLLPPTQPQPQPSHTPA